MFEQVQVQLRNSSVGRWYASKEANERRVIASLGLATFVVVFWLGVWQPIADWRDIETNRYQNAQALLDWLEANESRARAAARQASPAAAGRSLIPIITRTADAQGLQLNRLQPETNGVVSVVLQAQSFNDIVAWVAQLNENNGVTVLRASVDSQGMPGYVNAQVRFQ